MKLSLHIFSVLIFLAPQLTWAYDWEEEEVGGEREIQLNRVRNYVGGADEDELKVQKVLPSAPRSPDGAERVKRDDADPDDHSATE